MQRKKEERKKNKKQRKRKGKKLKKKENRKKIRKERKEKKDKESKEIKEQSSCCVHDMTYRYKTLLSFRKPANMEIACYYLSLNISALLSNYYYLQ